MPGIFEGEVEGKPQGALCLEYFKGSRKANQEVLRLTLVLKVTTDSGRHLNHTQIRTLSACRMTLLDSCSVRHFGELAKFFFSDLPALPARPP